MQYYPQFGFEAGAPEYRCVGAVHSDESRRMSAGRREQIFPRRRFYLRFSPSITRFYVSHNLSAVRETYDKGPEKSEPLEQISATYSSGTITKNQPRGPDDYP